jgi:hypothetical protein
MERDIRATVTAALVMFAIMLAASFAMRPSRPNDTACLRAALRLNPPANWRVLARTHLPVSGLCRVAERLDEKHHAAHRP